MASFLILAKDLPNAGKVEGDPISVKDESEAVTTPSGTWLWSAQEDIRRWVAEGNPRGQFPNLFYVIDVDLPIERARRALQEHVRVAIPGSDPEANAPDEADRIVRLGKYRWRFGIDAGMTAGERQALRRDRVLALARDRINAVVLDRSGDDVLDTDSPRDAIVRNDPVRDTVRTLLRG